MLRVYERVSVDQQKQASVTVGDISNGPTTSLALIPPMPPLSRVMSTTSKLVKCRALWGEHEQILWSDIRVYTCRVTWKAIETELATSCGTWPLYS